VVRRLLSLGSLRLRAGSDWSPDILLLEEPNCFANHDGRDFVAFFNRMHRDMGNPRMKGTCIRAGLLPELDPLPLFQRLSGIIALSTARSPVVRTTMALRLGRLS